MELNFMYKSAHSFYKNNSNIIFPRADKGNITVVLNKNYYISKMDKLLSDKMTHSIIKKNSATSIERDLNNIFK